MARLGARQALGGFARVAGVDRPLVEEGGAPIDEHAVDVLLGPWAHSTSLQRSMLAARRRLTAWVWLSIAASSRSMRSTLKRSRSFGEAFRPLATWLRLRPR